MGVEVFYPVLCDVLTYFQTAGSPSVYVFPSTCNFSLDGPYASGVEGDGHYFMGTYTRYCPRLSRSYIYCIYTLCLSTTIVSLPFETCVPAISYRIRPQHWVSIAIIYDHHFY